MSFPHNNVSSTPENAEIHGYPHPQLTPGVYTSNTQSSNVQELHVLLLKGMRKNVSAATATLKQMPVEMQPIPAVPLSMKRPEDDGIIPISSKEELETLLQGKQLPRVSSLPPGEIHVSFNLPQDLCLHGLDLEKLQPLEGRSASTPTDRQFTISERLAGWKINRRQRIKEPHHYDTYFHHHQLTANFRSVVEVADFILYEICSKTGGPRSSQKGKYSSSLDLDLNQKPEQNIEECNSGNKEGKLGTAVEMYWRSTWDYLTKLKLEREPGPEIKKPPAKQAGRDPANPNVQQQEDAHLGPVSGDGQLQVAAGDGLFDELDGIIELRVMEERGDQGNLVYTYHDNPLMGTDLGAQNGLHSDHQRHSDTPELAKVVNDHDELQRNRWHLNRSMAF